MTLADSSAERRVRGAQERIGTANLIQRAAGVRNDMANAPNDLAIAQELEKQIAELEGTAASIASQEEIERLREQVVALRQKVSGPPQDAWQRVLLARHPQRPYTLDYIQMLCADFMELHGDRRFADDAAMITGLARFEDRSVIVVGHQKGRDTKQKVRAFRDG